MSRSSKDLFELYARHVNPGLARVLEFMGLEGLEERAEGCYLWDSEGRKYLDFLGGFGVFALGHRPHAVVEAVRRQLDLMPLSSKLLVSPLQAELGALLAEITPGDLQYSFFCTSGAEAVEGCLKLARAATSRPKIVTTEGAFHGKTLGALSVSGRDVYRKPFEPLLPGVVRVPFGDDAALRGTVDRETAAVILEPVQGEGGVRVAPPDYLPAARETCDRNGALLILDEVQTGFGRTGKMFACEHWGVAPDLMALGKALGGGVMPIAAVVGTPVTWKIFEESPLIHSSTFGGAPTGCAAALAAIKEIRDRDLPAHAAEVGGYLLQGLADIKARFPQQIVDVRGLGLLTGIEFAEPDFASLVVSGLAARGVIAAYTLNQPQVLRAEPPLIVTREQIDAFLDALRASVEQAVSLLGQ
jgi:putrescine aminotransferase